ncbi:MAG: flagellar hook-associated protein FlgL [Alicycliphilus sp.]|jgi:flagellar hook-associated protein 3 FlgL|uniref:Flagellar hook-associated protein FlgL n=1 Tax=Diaphorobacter limosus TaxID=3036128 RepID=A0ABZ0J1N9_9BURK|nr:flagellar hook-associated protein FlgL [Diaphorobacter sp. Y-1]MBP6753007.1 flagellar hook-associated protein FlgL [Alicycliphilus sp.]MBP8138033.1 flagellar hook-associated protein FlgL [Alicycliphilus sp.]MBP8779915.1 flagellar hook-associated protein FlgL [Alicycliphilus sp.]WOO31763.1 flagellar hook-associated protein FlgL [Diaphorobacter sp. Y-1]HRN64486.1 flagellar hook-associated protein FlgL [Alicycliphilus sp.]
MSSSFFRVSTANMYDSSVRNLSTRQKTLVDLQENLTSGKRVVRPSDDPVAAAQAERALTRISRIQTEQRALEVQRNAITQAETTLGDAIGLVQEMRQLMVGAGGGALKNEDRKTYANQIQSLQEQLRDVINRKDTNGIPLLGALGSALQPFTGPLTGSPDYQFIGQPGQASSDSTSIATTVDGHAALMFDPVRDGIYGASVTQAPGSSLVTSAVTTSNRDVLAGAGYELQIGGVTTSGGNTQVQYSLTKNGVAVPGGPFTASAVTGQPIPITITDGGVSVMNFSLQGTPVVGDKVGLQPSPSLMSSIDSAIKGITNATSSTQAAQTVSQALAHMDAGIERLSNIRGYAGELLNRADRITGDQESRSIQLEADRSRAEDLDMLKGISDFQNANVGLEAALKSYAQVQRLSLFNYVNG